MAGPLVVAMALGACGGGSSTADDARGSDRGGAAPSVTEEPEGPPEVAAPDSPGGFEVGHTSFEATDLDRDGRTIKLDVWYPVDPGTAGDAARTNLPLAAGIGLESEVAVEDPPVSERSDQPLVVFSHGYGGINTQSADLMETLASHGFVVAAPEHTGNSQSSPGDTFDQAAANRVPDVSLVIDTMIERSRDPADAFAGRLDEDRVGVVGHSFGAMTAVGAVAGWAGAEPDPRVIAIVPISGVIDPELQSSERSGPNAGFTSTQLADIDVPVMLMGGTEDQDVAVENNHIAFDQLTDSPAVYDVVIDGATHTHFANVCAIGELLIGLGIAPEAWADIGAADLVEPYEATCGPEAFPIDEAIRLQNLYVVSFLHRHLNGDERYGWFLDDDVEPAVSIASRRR